MGGELLRGTIHVYVGKHSIEVFALHVSGIVILTLTFVFQGKADFASRFFNCCIDKLVTRGCRLEKEHEQLKEKYRRCRGDLRSTEELRSQYERLTRDNSNLEIRVQELEKREDEASLIAAQELSAAEARIKELEEANAVLQDKYNVLDQRRTGDISELTHRLNIATSNHELEKTRRAELASEVSQLQQKLSEKSKKFNSAWHDKVIAEAEVKSLHRDNRALTDDVTRLNRRVEELRTMTERYGDFYLTARLAFMNCIQQLRFWNPGLELNLRGVSPDFQVDHGKLIDLNNNYKEVDLNDPNLPVFDPDASITEEEWQSDSDGESVDSERPVKEVETENEKEQAGQEEPEATSNATQVPASIALCGINPNESHVSIATGVAETEGARDLETEADIPATKDVPTPSSDLVFPENKV